MLSKLKPFIDTDTRKMFFNAHVKSHIDYCSTVWDGSSEVHLKRLDSLYRRAAKQILPDPSLTTEQKLRKLQILPLNKHLMFNKGIMMHKVCNQSVPGYLRCLFSKAQTKYQNSRHNLALPLPRIDIYKTSLSFSGPSLWNALPPSVKNVARLNSFRTNLFKHLMSHDPP